MVNKMKGLCLVAHPDDCVIFGYSYMYNHPEIKWTVGYLTYTEQEARGHEFQQFWHRRGVTTVFLGFEDDWRDNEQKKFTRWSEEQAEQACWRLARDFDIVLTHDEVGDYGHIHHILVHRAVQWHQRLVTFAKINQGKKYSLPHDAYSLDELPLHADVIKGFHADEHRNFYKEQA